MKNQCPQCAMSLSSTEKLCPLCGAPVTVQLDKPKSEQPNQTKKPGALAIGCLVVSALFFGALELSLLRGALSRDPDANMYRVWALVFGVLLLVSARALWNKLR